LPPRARLAPTPLPYPPLAVGNQWIYVQSGRLAGEPFTVQVTGTGQFGSLTYYQLIGYSDTAAWVRYNAAGELVRYDPSDRLEKLWYPFAAADGFSYRSHVSEPCVQQASLRTRRGEVQVPVGAYGPHLAVEYGAGPCADAGFSEEVFVAGIGMVRRTSITIAGPRTGELAWARVNGVVIPGPELSFTVAIDRPKYVANLMPPVDPVASVPVLRAVMTARNTTGQPITLDFSSGQRYDLVIRDSRGQMVFQWSQGRAFTLALGQLILQGEQVFVEEIRLADRSGRVFPEGRYTLEAWLTTIGEKLFASMVPFQIQHVF